MPCAQCTDPARCDRAGLCQEFRATPGPAGMRQVGWVVQTRYGILFAETVTEEQRTRWQPVYVAAGVTGASRGMTAAGACAAGGGWCMQPECRACFPKAAPASGVALPDGGQSNG